MIGSSRAGRTAVCLALLAGVAACSGQAKHAAGTPSTTPATGASSLRSTATPTTVPVNPFTGLAPLPAGPVIAVKVDDTEGGRPQRGIDLADVVYVEQAEGGLTRLLAIFATDKPDVEAVRSTRASDPELVAQYGAIDYVASGGAPNPLAVLDASPLHSDINDRGGPGLTRDDNRNEPYNVVADLAQISTLIKGSGAKNIGLAFSASAAAYAADPVATTIRTTVGATGVGFDWNAATGRYVREIDGVPQTASDGRPIATPNVVVQFCSVTPYPQDVDVNGNPSQYTHTIGSGQAVIFRNGRRIQGTWSRPSAGAGTTFTATNGRRITLAPGGEWVVLVSTGAALTSS
ncbi:MAG TPA: DUF3048 domain-containing protein [Jatrophihabitantaceae bacterium]|nr:DUF3048 domain-containing protein [Jatrophihabitantaceae bacterium]